MAKQNFLAGGYYGKLGQTVGQRWKNIRTIRTYVKPKNPRTEAQQANRKTFATYVSDAQWGNAANYRSSVWDSVEKTEWALRMEQAAALEKDGFTGLNKVPLFPVGFVPPLSITEISLRDKEVLPVMSFTLGGDVPDGERLFSMLLDRYDDNGVFQDRHVLISYTTVENPGVLYAENPELIDFTKDVRVRIVSIDGTAPAEDMICSNEIPVGEAPKPVTDFDFTVTKAYIKNNLLYITVNQDYIDGAASVQNFTVDLPSEISGRTYTGEAAQINNDSGKFQFVFGNGLFSDTDMPYVGSGAKITANDFTWESADYFYTCSNVEQDLPYTNVSLSFYSVAILHDKLYVQFDKNIDADEKAVAAVAATYTDSTGEKTVSGGLSVLSELGGKLLCVFDGIPNTSSNFGYLTDTNSITVKYIAYRKNEISYVASCPKAQYTFNEIAVFYDGKDLTGASPYVSVKINSSVDADIKKIGISGLEDFGTAKTIASAYASQSFASNVVKFSLSGKVPSYNYGLWAGSSAQITMQYIAVKTDTEVLYMAQDVLLMSKDATPTITPKWNYQARSNNTVYLYLAFGGEPFGFETITGTGEYQTNSNGTAEDRPNITNPLNYIIQFSSTSHWITYTIGSGSNVSTEPAQVNCKVSVPAFQIRTPNMTYNVAAASVEYKNASNFILAWDVIHNPPAKWTFQDEDEGFIYGLFLPITWYSDIPDPGNYSIYDGSGWSEATESGWDVENDDTGDVLDLNYVEITEADSETFYLDFNATSAKKFTSGAEIGLLGTDTLTVNGNEANIRIIDSGVTFYALIEEIITTLE